MYDTDLAGNISESDNEAEIEATSDLQEGSKTSEGQLLDLPNAEADCTWFQSRLVKQSFGLKRK